MQRVLLELETLEPQPWILKGWQAVAPRAGLAAAAAHVPSAPLRLLVVSEERACNSATNVDTGAFELHSIRVLLGLCLQDIRARKAG